jgi:hypothetical protein
MYYQKLLDMRQNGFFYDNIFQFAQNKMDHV